MVFLSNVASCLYSLLASVPWLIFSCASKCSSLDSVNLSLSLRVHSCLLAPILELFVEGGEHGVEEDSLLEDVEQQ